MPKFLVPFIEAHTGSAVVEADDELSAAQKLEAGEALHTSRTTPVANTRRAVNGTITSIDEHTVHERSDYPASVETANS